MNIPEGYVLVPVEPTRIQLVAGLATNGIHPIYCAMVAAAQPVEFPAYDEAKERELFEVAYPLDHGVTWVKDMGKTGSYAVWINCGSGFWACVNASYQSQIKWEVWSKCAKSRARSAE